MQPDNEYKSVYFIFKNLFPVALKSKLWLSKIHQEQNVLNSYQKKAIIILIHQTSKNLVILSDTMPTNGETHDALPWLVSEQCTHSEVQQINREIQPSYHNL